MFLWIAFNWATEVCWIQTTVNASAFTKQHFTAFCLSNPLPPKCFLESGEWNLCNMSSGKFSFCSTPPAPHYISWCSGGFPDPEVWPVGSIEGPQPIISQVLLCGAVVLLVWIQPLHLNLFLDLFVSL